MLITNWSSFNSNLCYQSLLSSPNTNNLLISWRKHSYDIYALKRLLLNATWRNTRKYKCSCTLYIVTLNNIFSSLLLTYFIGRKFWQTHQACTHTHTNTTCAPVWWHLSIWASTVLCCELYSVIFLCNFLRHEVLWTLLVL